MFTSLIGVATIALTIQYILCFNLLQITLEETMASSERQQLKYCLSGGVGVVVGHFHLWPLDIRFVNVVLARIGGWPKFPPVNQLLSLNISL